jgi:hypothetical protein
MKTFYNILSIGLVALSLIVQPLFCHGQSTVDELIFKAMKDELKRSSSELFIPPYKPPFFVAYQLMDGRSLNIRATLGSLTYSEEKPSRALNIRLMVGDYALSDENFSGIPVPITSMPPSLPLPLENDYSAIRRAIWIASDQSYKRAIANYEQKVNALKQQNKQEEERLDDYTRIIPVTSLNKFQLEKYDKSKLESFVRDISGEFKSYPQLSSSSVELNLISAIVYVNSSEGTTLKIPYALASLYIKSTIQAVDGEYLNDQLIYHTFPQQLPKTDQVKKEIKKMAENLSVMTKAPSIDSYSGPVIFEGDAVAEIFLTKIFRYARLIASRTPVYAVEMNGFSATNRMDDRINQKIISGNLTIKDTPGLKVFNNIPLIGSYELDAEGVKPKDELVLVDKGILRTLLNDRVPKGKIRDSNGHRRFNVYTLNASNSLILMSGVSPGVVNVLFNNGESADEVKRRVLKEAQENGLDYIYKIKKLETFSGQIRSIPMRMGVEAKPLMVYKIFVKTGEEQLVRSAVLGDFQLNNFKYIPYGSKEQHVYNTTLGPPVSVIVPKVLVFNDVNLEKIRSGKPNLPIVPNPLN